MEYKMLSANIYQETVLLINENSFIPILFIVKKTFKEHRKDRKRKE
jgi:hypothetical protein